MIAMDMDGMRNPETIRGSSKLHQNLSRSHIVVRDDFIQTTVTVATALPHLHAAGIHQLDRVTTSGIQQPCHGGINKLRSLLRDLFHDQMVVAHHHIETLINNRSILQLIMGMPRADRRDGGIKGCCVAETCVQITGRERAGDGAQSS